MKKLVSTKDLTHEEWLKYRKMGWQKCLKRYYSFRTCPNRYSRTFSAVFWLSNAYSEKVHLFGQEDEDKEGIKLSSGKLMGYARVSSSGQNLDRQLLELKQYVPEENIIVDKASGKDLARTGYLALKGPLGLREGDTLIIKSLDRLSRRKSDIRQELEWFQKHKVRLKIIDLPTTMISFPENQEWIQDMINNIILEVMASLAEQERVMIHQRQREGIEAAKKRGKYLGRPPVAVPENWEEVYSQWKAGKISAKQAMTECHLRRGKFYEFVKKHRDPLHDKKQYHDAESDRGGIV